MELRQMFIHLICHSMVIGNTTAICIEQLTCFFNLIVELLMLLHVYIF